MKVKISFHEQKGKLTVHEEWSNGKEGTIEILYQELISVSPTAPMPGGKWSVMVWQKSSGIKYVPFNSKDDAVSVAKYLAEMSGLGSVHESQEVVSSSTAPVEDAPRQITCPPATQLSCGSFNNLLEHNDPEIVGYVHPKDSTARIYACFSTEGENKFFVVLYGNSPKTNKEDSFLMSAFENGVQHDAEFDHVRWVSAEFGIISGLTKEQNRSGSITQSELNYSRSFTNLSGKQTNHSLAIRKSTGTYVERYSFPDKKGEVQLATYTGSCVQLH